MMLVEPTQKNVATIASPRCGFVGLNPLMNVVPLRPSVLFTWFRTMRVGAAAAARPPPVASATALGLPGAGLTCAGAVGSLQPAANSAPATSPAKLPTVVRVTITVSCGVCATHRRQRQRTDSSLPQGQGSRHCLAKLPALGLHQVAAGVVRERPVFWLAVSSCYRNDGRGCVRRAAAAAGSKRRCNAARSEARSAP